MRSAFSTSSGGYGPEVRDLLDGGPQQAVLVEVLDDGVADLQDQLVGDGHVELPEQVVVEVGRLGERVLDGRQLGDLGRRASRRLASLSSR